MHHVCFGTFLLVLWEKLVRLLLLQVYYLFEFSAELSNAVSPCSFPNSSVFVRQYKTFNYIHLLKRHAVLTSSIITRKNLTGAGSFPFCHSQNRSDPLIIPMLAGYEKRSMESSKIFLVLNLLNVPYKPLLPFSAVVNPNTSPITLYITFSRINEDAFKNSLHKAFFLQFTFSFASSDHNIMAFSSDVFPTCFKGTLTMSLSHSITFTENACLDIHRILYWILFPKISHSTRFNII